LKSPSGRLGRRLLKIQAPWRKPRPVTLCGLFQGFINKVVHLMQGKLCMSKKCWLWFSNDLLLAGRIHY
jgi:hypothetical protein